MTGLGSAATADPPDQVVDINAKDGPAPPDQVVDITTKEGTAVTSGVTPVSVWMPGRCGLKVKRLIQLV